ncbi:MAG: photosynthetic complex putative assembly protein PuhB [Pseudomonadota bacterium]
MPEDRDITAEPIRGLPENLPKGEEILWQGRPDVWSLARSALSIHWVGGYFVVLAAYRIAVSAPDLGFVGALPYAIPFVVMGLLAVLVLWACAFAMARATVYTLTTARIAMRVGAALTITLNLPYQKLESADLELRRNGTGTIALTPKAGVRLSYWVLWPHVRPWSLRRIQPSLRCIKDVEKVASILAEAAETRISQPEIALVSDRMTAAE